jgi:hypothetical protein
MMSRVEGGEDTGNGVCDPQCEDTGNGVCALSCECGREDTGNGVCGRREEWTESPRTHAVSLRDWWLRSVPIGLGIEAVAALYHWWHWKQGVSGLLSVALQSRMLLGVWSGNVGGESA